MGGGVERRGRELAGAAMHLLALGDIASATRLLRRARVVHAAPELRLLSALMATAGASGGVPSETKPSAFQDTILQLSP